MLCTDISFAWNLSLSSNRTFLPIYNWTILDHWAGKECYLLLTITTDGLPQHVTLFNKHYIIKYMFWLIYCRAIVFLLFHILLRSWILKLGLKLLTQKKFCIKLFINYTYENKSRTTVTSQSSGKRLICGCQIGPN